MPRRGSLRRLALFFPGRSLQRFFHSRCHHRSRTPPSFIAAPFIHSSSNPGHRNACTSTDIIDVNLIEGDKIQFVSSSMRPPLAVNQHYRRRQPPRKHYWSLKCVFFHLIPGSTFDLVFLSRSFTL